MLKITRNNRNKNINYEIENNKSIIGYLVRKGLFGEKREQNGYSIIDNLLLYRYKYETSHFYKSVVYQTTDNYFKFSMKTINYQYDFVSNDLEATHFNDLKTVITFNTKVFRFVRVSQRFRPLQIFGYTVKRLEGLYPKLKEYYNLTGSNVNYHTVQIMNNVRDKTATMANIFIYFSYLRTYLINVIRKVDQKQVKSLFGTFFGALSRSKRFLKAFASGFIFKFRNPRRRYFIKYDPEAKNKPIKTLFDVVTKKIRTSRRRKFWLRSLYKKFKNVFLPKKTFLGLKSKGGYSKVSFIVLDTNIVPKDHEKVNLYSKLFAKRYMHNSSKMFIYTRNFTGITIPRRNMSCLHGGNFVSQNAKPLTQDSDTSGQHKVVFHTVCNEKQCKTTNCADKASKGVCPGRTPTQNEGSIPPSGTQFKTFLVGNTTSKIPSNKKGIVINPNKNYNGDSKAQEMVVESSSIVVNYARVSVDLKSTKFLQEPQNHIKVISTIP